MPLSCMSITLVLSCMHCVVFSCIRWCGFACIVPVPLLQVTSLQRWVHLFPTTCIMRLPIQGRIATRSPVCPSCRLFPLAMMITPNLSEASALLDGRDISDISSMKAAARDLHALGPEYVLVKGGHLQQGDHPHSCLELNLSHQSSAD